MTATVQEKKTKREQKEANVNALLLITSSKCSIFQPKEKKVVIKPFQYHLFRKTTKYLVFTTNFHLYIYF